MIANEKRRSLYHRLRATVWVVTQPSDIFVRAHPEICLRTLATATKPSSKRLHLRDVFAQGRRYTIRETKNGFRLTTNSAVLWSKRRRTRSCAVVMGSFSRIGEDITRVHLESYNTLENTVTAFILPILIGPMMLVMPWWPPPIRVIGVSALVIASWIANRYNASLEATEILYFVQKALNDLESAEILPLSSSVIDISHAQADFASEWERFVESHEEPPKSPSTDEPSKTT